MKDTLKIIGTILHVIAIITFALAIISYWLGNTVELMILLCTAIFSGVMGISFKLLDQ